MTENFYAETAETREKWNDIFQVQKEKNWGSQILYLAELIFMNEGKIRTFSTKGKLKNLLLADLPLKNGLRKTLWTQRKWKQKKSGNFRKRKNNEIDKNRSKLYPSPHAFSSILLYGWSQSNTISCSV